MALEWQAVPGARRTLCARSEHGEWEILPPSPSDDLIRLAYARTRADGFAFPRTFAWFGSEEEAMMAAELMESPPAVLRAAADQPGAIGFEPYIEGLHRFGGGLAAEVLLADKPEMVGLTVTERRRQDRWVHQITIYAPGDYPEGPVARPPTVPEEATRALDLEIVGQIMAIRLSRRGVRGFMRPVTPEEFAGWMEARDAAPSAPGMR